MSRIAGLRRLYEESDGNTNIEFEQFMPALAAAWPEIDALLTAAQGAVATAQGMFERTGTVIDKWPPPDELMPPWESGRRAPWTRERIAALPDEVRWQGVVFSLYTDLCQIDSLARQVDEGEP